MNEPYVPTPLYAVATLEDRAVQRGKVEVGVREIDVAAGGPAVAALEQGTLEVSALCADRLEADVASVACCALATLDPSPLQARAVEIGVSPDDCTGGREVSGYTSLGRRAAISGVHMRLKQRSAPSPPVSPTPPFT